MTMIDNEGSESGDEDVRQYRREKSRERVGAWAAGQMDLDDGGEGRSRRRRGRGDSEERREGWRGRLRLARRVSRDAGSEMAVIGETRGSASVGAVRAAEEGEIRAEGGGERSAAGSSRPGMKHIAGLMKRDGKGA